MVGARILISEGAVFEGWVIERHFFCDISQEAKLCMDK
jgi:hypothetical protein